MSEVREGPMKAIWNILRSLMALWLVELALVVAPRSEKGVYAQAVHMLCGALKDGLETLPTIVWTKGEGAK